ncbi:MAG: UbiA family prenyltransferase [Candidatus Aenigmarchaeota archaeon]|nr:UbiA family prenyltransferase [Candidatus Aenigmarchaeota archaeon]
MGKRSILINSITLNIPKNIIQFSIGIIFFVAFFGKPDFGLVLFAGTSFLLTYSAVYVYNDIIDAEEDSKHLHKKLWKLVGGGFLDTKQAYRIYTGLVICGLSMALFVNNYFFIMMLALLALNFIHSNPKTHFKDSLRKTAVNMTFIEFLKYSSGWFALTSNISYFPFWVVVVLSIAYNLSYIIYKTEKKRDLLKDNKKFFISMGITAIISYILAFFNYGIPLVMILMLIIPSFLIAIFRYVTIEYNSLHSTMITMMTLLLAVLLSFSLILMPAFAVANIHMSNEIDNYTNNMKESIPDYLKSRLNEITLEMEKYEDLDELVDEINDSIMNISNSSLLSN